MDPTEREPVVARPVPRQWLSPYAVNSAELDRMCADLELVDRMAAAGYTGREWDYFATELIRYGMAVLIGWMRSELIWARVAERTRFGQLTRPVSWQWCDDAWDEIAVNTLLEAVPNFRDSVLRSGRWNPRGRASLKTFFIGQCLFRYPNVYRRWYAAAQRRRDEIPDNPQDLQTWHTATLSGPERQITAHDELTRELSDLDPRTRTVLQLRAQGYEQTEVGEQLGISRKTVEMIEKHHRTRAPTAATRPAKTTSTANSRIRSRGVVVAERPERIEHLVERSSLGDPDARRARGRISTAAAHAVLRQISAAGSSGRFRSAQSARSQAHGRDAGGARTDGKKFEPRRGMDGR